MNNKISPINIINTNVPIEKELVMGVEKKIRSISHETMEFVDKIKNSSTEIVLEFLNKNAIKVPTRDSGNQLYVYKNLFLHRTNGQKALNIEENLKNIPNHDFIPTYVKHFELGNDDFLTILESGNEKFLPYRKVAIKPEIKEKFKNELSDMAKNGVFNKEILANRNPLFVTPDGSHITYGDWSFVDIINNANEKNVILNKIKDIF